MPKLTTVLEDHVRYRDGKKWKQRYCMLTKPDAKTGSITMYIAKHNNSLISGIDIDEKNTRHFIIDEMTGFEYGRHLDKESSVMVLVGRIIVHCIAFSSTETMFRWAETLKKLVKPSHFHVTLKQASETSGLFNKMSAGTQGNLHVQNKRFCLIGEPADGNKFICEWPIDNLISVDISDTEKERTKIISIKSNNKIHKVKGIFKFEIYYQQKSQFQIVMETFLQRCVNNVPNFVTNFFNERENSCVISNPCSSSNNQSNESEYLKYAKNDKNSDGKITTTNNDNKNFQSNICTKEQLNLKNNISPIKTTLSNESNNDINYNDDKISLNSQEKRSCEIPIPRSREHSGPNDHHSRQIPDNIKTYKHNHCHANAPEHHNTKGFCNKRQHSCQHYNQKIDTLCCSAMTNDDYIQEDDGVTIDNSPGGLVLTTSNESSTNYLLINQQKSGNNQNLSINVLNTKNSSANSNTKNFDSGYYGDNFSHLLNNIENRQPSSSISTSYATLSKHDYLNLSHIYQDNNNSGIKTNNNNINNKTSSLPPTNTNKHIHCNHVNNNLLLSFYNGVLENPSSMIYYRTYLLLLKNMWPYKTELATSPQQNVKGRKRKHSHLHRSNSYNCNLNNCGTKVPSNGSLNKTCYHNYQNNATHHQHHYQSEPLFITKNSTGNTNHEESPLSNTMQIMSSSVCEDDTYKNNRNHHTNHNINSLMSNNNNNNNKLPKSTTTEPLMINCDQLQPCSSNENNWPPQSSVHTPGSSTDAKTSSILSSQSIAKDSGSVQPPPNHHYRFKSTHDPNNQLPFKNIQQLTDCVQACQRSGTSCHSLMGYCQFLMMLKDVRKYARLLILNENSATGSSNTNEPGTKSPLPNCYCSHNNGTCRNCFYKMIENVSSFSNRSNKSQLPNTWSERLQNDLKISPLSSQSSLSKTNSHLKYSTNYTGNILRKSLSTTSVTTSTSLANTITSCPSLLSLPQLQMYSTNSSTSVQNCALTHFNLRLICEMVLNYVSFSQHVHQGAAACDKHGEYCAGIRYAEMASGSSIDKFPNNYCAYVHSNCSSCPNSCHAPTNNPIATSNCPDHPHTPYLLNHLQLSLGGSCSNPELLLQNSLMKSLPDDLQTPHPSSSNNTTDKHPSQQKSFNNSTQYSFDSPPRYQNISAHLNSSIVNTNNTFPKYQQQSSKSCSKSATGHTDESGVVGSVNSVSCSSNTKSGSLKKIKKYSPNFLAPLLHQFGVSSGSSSKLPTKMFTRRKTPSTHSTLSEPLCTSDLNGNHGSGASFTSPNSYSTQSSHFKSSINSHRQHQNSTSSANSANYYNFQTGNTARKSHSFTKRSLSVVLDKQGDDNGNGNFLNETGKHGRFISDGGSGYQNRNRLPNQPGHNYINLESDIDPSLSFYSKQSSYLSDPSYPSSNSDHNSTLHCNTYMNCQQRSFANTTDSNQDDDDPYRFVEMPEEIRDPSRNYGNLSTTGNMFPSNSSLYLQRQGSHDNSVPEEGITNCNSSQTYLHRRVSGVSANSMSPKDSLPPVYPGNHYTMPTTEEGIIEPSNAPRLNYSSIKHCINTTKPIIPAQSSHLTFTVATVTMSAQSKSPSIIDETSSSHRSTDKPPVNYTKIDVKSTHALWQVDRMLSGGSSESRCDETSQCKSTDLKSYSNHKRTNEDVGMASSNASCKTSSKSSNKKSNLRRLISLRK